MSLDRIEKYNLEEIGKKIDYKVKFLLQALPLYVNIYLKHNILVFDNTVQTIY